MVLAAFSGFYLPYHLKVTEGFGQLQAVDLESIEPALRADTEGDNLRQDVPETFENRIIHRDPLLVTMAVEVLNKILIKANDLRLISGFGCRPDGLMVTHFQFADDSIPFPDNDVSQIRDLQMIVLLLGYASSLKSSLLQEYDVWCLARPLYPQR